MAASLVVVFDEEWEMRALFAEILFDAGYLVEAFASIEEGAGYVTQSTRRLVLLFGGLRPLHEFLVRVRGRDVTHARMVLATGSADVSAIAGVEVIKKPLTIDALIGAIARAA